MSLPALAIGVALLGVNGFFVAAEFGILAARRSRIEQLASEGSRSAAHTLAGLRELSLMLAAAQLGITMASLGLGAVAEPAVAAGIEAALVGVALPGAVRHGIAFALALSIVVFLHMVVGEMAPKSIAISNPERTALTVAPAFRAFALVFRPFIRLLNAAANAVIRALGVQPQDELAMAHSPGDLLLLLDESAREGELGPEEQRLLARAIDLAGLDAQAAMIPRADMVAVAADTAVDELERIASDTGRSRLVVHEGDLDRVLGILHVKDLLGITGDERGGARAADLARPALITPESRPLEALMIDMRQQRQHVAIVVDEFGSVSGLVSLEDLIEELIGEFEDETDADAGRVRRSPDSSLLVPGGMRPDELRQETGIELPEGDWETVAGLVIAQLGRLPEVGDEATTDGIRLRVTRMDGHRVVEVAVLPGTP